MIASWDTHNLTYLYSDGAGSLARNLRRPFVYKNKEWYYDKVWQWSQILEGNTWQEAFVVVQFDWIVHWFFVIKDCARSGLLLSHEHKALFLRGNKQNRGKSMLSQLTKAFEIKQLLEAVSEL